MTRFRVERDSMGEMQVPVNALLRGSDGAGGGKFSDLGFAIWRGGSSRRWG